MQVHEGGCHCGRVRFRVSAPLAGVTDCNCSICAKKGFLHWIVPADAFALLAGDEDLVTYEFNTGTAKHRHCRVCGIHAFYVPRSDPDKIDVNVRCLDGVDVKQLSIAPFDGQNWEQAMSAPVPWRRPGPTFALVATLRVRREAEAQFRAYERKAAQVMSKYGGAIVQTVAVSGDDPAAFEELHVVTFPDAEAFAAYQRDPEIAAAAPLRDAAIVATKVSLGAPGPAY
jgi:uncharacterized protein (DUF1330 family)